MSGIVGLTDRGMAFPEIGQIRKGEEKTRADQPGKDLTYFRVVFAEAEREAQRIFEQHYGSEPAKMQIWLPFPDRDRCWEAAYEAYTASEVKARAGICPLPEADPNLNYFEKLKDPETLEVLVKDWRDADGKLRVFDPDAPVGHYMNQKGKRVALYATPAGRLKVILPILGRLAFFTVHTTSIWDIAEISGNLDALQWTNAQVTGNNSLSRILIDLYRRPKKISVPKASRTASAGGERIRVEKWLLHLEANPEWVRTKVAESYATSLPASPAGAFLPEGNGYENGDSEEVIEAEVVEENEPEAAKPATEPKSKKQEAAAVGDGEERPRKNSTMFWEFVTVNKIPKSKAQAVLAKNNHDYTDAYWELADELGIAG